MINWVYGGCIELNISAWTMWRKFERRKISWEVLVGVLCGLLDDRDWCWENNVWRLIMGRMWSTEELMWE